MRFSKLLIPTLREDPGEAEIASHRLMVRSALIRKIAAGIYAYLPLGLRCLAKVENIIREEMTRAGAQEVLLPAVIPAELWRESGRWDIYGKELLRFRDRHERDFCIGPTHEEVITDIVRREVRSYRQLPMNIFQIQTKFRDEIRPRFGVMRAREFQMKDGYSFHADAADLNREYEVMREAYSEVFRRCGLDFTAVEADTGTIGGSSSHEFMVLADSGEDVIANCGKCGYAANLEKAEVSAPMEKAAPPTRKKMKKVDTPGMKTVEEVSSFLGVRPRDLIKTLVCIADEQPVVALVRGDHELNETKLKNHLGASTMRLATDEEVLDSTSAPAGFLGPVGVLESRSIRIVADHAVETVGDGVTGANEADAHVVHVVPGRDFAIKEKADLRLALDGDRCNHCGEEIAFRRGIEVGHIFKLGTKYSEPMRATFLDAQGKEKPFTMGTYGIGLSRTVAAAIEQNHDEKGIIFPRSIAPFDAVVLLLGADEGELGSCADSVYKGLLERGIDAALDDRAERPGVKFNDAALIGIPVRVIVGQKGLREGRLEIELRRDGSKRQVAVDRAVDEIEAVLEEVP